jgi:hypothetical protein
MGDTMEPLRRSAMFLGDHNGPISTVAGPLTVEANYEMEKAHATYVERLGNECARQRKMHARDVVQGDDVRHALEELERARIVHVYSNSHRSDYAFFCGLGIGAMVSLFLGLL